MKPYQQITIKECGEPLLPIPLEKFAVELPHPYVELGAEYGDKSPYCLRQGVIAALLKAQFLLNKRHPEWKLKIYDAYRPVGVQQFMVDYTFNLLLKKQGIPEKKLSALQRQAIWERVYELWAAPSLDPATPPPHSTGAAIDLTLIDEKGNTLDMGGEIDEISERSHPDFYAKGRDLQQQQYHCSRQLLHRVMTNAGFQRHPGEWWHFSLGDQMWAWLHNQEHHNQEHEDNTAIASSAVAEPIARYGRV